VLVCFRCFRSPAARRNCSPRRIAFPAFRVLAMLAATMVGSMAAVRAQTPGASPPPAPGKNADVGVVVGNINDLGLLRALQPVKLAAAQLTPLLTLLRKLEDEARSGYKKDDDALRALAAEVDKARTSALSGTPIPAELETKVAALSKAAEERVKKVRTDAVLRLLAVVKETFTPEQQKAMASQTEKVLGGKRVPREFAANPSKAPAQVVQDLAVAYFIEMIFLNERSVLVLSQMKPPTDAAAPTPPPTAPGP